MLFATYKLSSQRSTTRENKATESDSESAKIICNRQAAYPLSSSKEGPNADSVCERLLKAQGLRQSVLRKNTCILKTSPLFNLSLR